MTETKHSLDVTILGAETLATEMPSTYSDMQAWAESALVKALPDISYQVNYQFVSTKMMETLNKEFRQIAKPTNVLSFPSNDPFDPKDPFVGDIAICLDVLKQEAKDQNKPLENHLAHLVMHAILHCQGFDHITDDDAEVMESLEIKLLKEFDIADPYQ